MTVIQIIGPMSTLNTITTPSQRLALWVFVITFGIVVCAMTSAHMTSGETRRDIALSAADDLDVQLTSGPAPDFEVIREDGSTLKLSDLRGKVVFINFWASYCRPCMTEMPLMELLKDKMKHVPFEIVAVSSDESWEQIKTARVQWLASKRRADPKAEASVSKMIIGQDPGLDAIAKTYGTGLLPETYVVDRRGQLRLRFVGPQTWTDSRIHRYLEWLSTSS